MIRALPLFLLLALLPARGETLIGTGGKAEWRYLDGAAAPAEWKGPEFDDSSWKSGKAPLGYGLPKLGTTLESGADPEKKPVTAWFRRTLELNEYQAGTRTLLLSLRADDGAAVYLNGKPIARFNLAEDAGPETPALTERSGKDELAPQRIEVAAAALVKGKNVIAVEVHQGSRTSSDLFLDLSVQSLPPVESVRLADGAKEATLAYLRQHFIGPDMKVPDGYLDGGRRMILSQKGVVMSTREILVIDRPRDATLRGHLAFAKSEELAKLGTEERARRIARYVDSTLSPQGDRVAALEAVENFTIEYANRPVLFGEMAQVCQGGVCRHRALLFKMMCDEAGLKSALVRGNYSHGLTQGGHAWNELTLDDGSLVIVDVMNPLPEFKFLSEKDKAAEPYISVRNERLYPRTKAAE